MENVAIIGASNKPDRYSYKAFQLLREHGYQIFPINPALEEIEGVQAYKKLDQVPDKVDTVTLYMNPLWLEKVIDDIIAKHPRRVIFNPGTESEKLMNRLEEEGIGVQQACTLVLLKTGQFENPI